MRCEETVRARLIQVVVVVTLAISAAALCGCTSAPRIAAPSPSARLGDPHQLGVADVDRLFREFATYGMSSGEETSGAAYEALVLANVNIRAYASDEASAMPRTRLRDYSRDAPASTGAAKQATLTDALRVYDRVAASQGATGAYEAMGSAEFRLESSPLKRDDELLLWLCPDNLLLDFMTLPPTTSGSHPQPAWSWRVHDVAIVGTDTARISFSAASLENWRGWSFKDPTRTYAKVWRFSYDPGRKRWQLAAWQNRMQFIESVQGNVTDPSGGLKVMPVWEVLDG